MNFNLFSNLLSELKGIEIIVIFWILFIYFISYIQGKHSKTIIWNPKIKLIIVILIYIQIQNGEKIVSSHFSLNFDLKS